MLPLERLINKFAHQERMGGCQTHSAGMAAPVPVPQLLAQPTVSDARSVFIQSVLADVGTHPDGCRLSRDATSFLYEELDQKSKDSLVPTENQILDFYAIAVSKVESPRCKNLLQFAASQSAVLLREIFQDVALKITTRLTAPFVIEWIDSAARIICVSNSMPVGLTAVSHRWTGRDTPDHSQYVVVVKDHPTVWWYSAGLSEAEVVNFEPLLPCWLDYVSLVQPSPAMVKMQMQYMGLVYIIGRSVICGNDLSPNTPAPSEYFERLWCMQVCSSTYCL